MDVTCKDCGDIIGAIIPNHNCPQMLRGSEKRIAVARRLACLEAVAEAARACVRPMLQYHAAKVGDCPGCIARRALEQRLRILDGGDK